MSATRPRSTCSMIDRPARGDRVEPHHVDQLLLEAGIVRQLEGPHQVGPDAPGEPDALHHGLGVPGVGGHGPTGPLGLALGGGVQGVVDEGLDAFLGDRRLPPPGPWPPCRCARCRRSETGPPRQHRSAGHPGALGDFGVGHVLGGHEERVGMADLSMGPRGRPGHPLQFCRCSRVRVRETSVVGRSRRRTRAAGRWTVETTPRALTRP